MKRIYNLKKDSKDSRDFLFLTHIKQIKPRDLPKSFDLRNTGLIPPIVDQGELGSCTANASSYGLRFQLKKNSNDFQPSRLYIYYFTRLLEGSVNYDSGASLRDTMRAIKKNGACDENIWNYDITKFTKKPSQQAITEGIKKRKSFQYLSVRNNINTIKNALYQGYPITIGIAVYSSFESDKVAQTGEVPLPDIKNENMLGGHAILMISYDDITRKFGFMNSWGTSWGNKGFFTLPYDYVLNPNLAFDFWAIKTF